MKLATYLKTLCPYCGSDKHRCDGKHVFGAYVVRYHQCRHCGRRFRSEEKKIPKSF